MPATITCAKKNPLKTGQELEWAVEIANAEGSRHLVADDPRDKRGEEHVVHKASYKEDFDPEDSTPYGRAKNGGKSGADPTDDQFPTVTVVELQKVAK
jgi:hypothetical protein